MFHARKVKKLLKQKTKVVLFHLSKCGLIPQPTLVLQALHKEEVE